MRVCVYVKSLQLCLFVTLWTVICQFALSMAFFQAIILEWVAMPLPRDLPDPEIEPTSLMSPALPGS